MEDNSFVPVIPDIKDHALRAPPTPILDSEDITSCAKPTTVSWSDWSTWPMALRLAMGTLLVAFILLIAYAGYVWFTNKKNAAPKEKVIEGPPRRPPPSRSQMPDMNEVLKTQAQLRRRTEEEARARAPAPVMTTVVIAAEETPQKSTVDRFEVIEEVVSEAAPPQAPPPAPQAPPPPQAAPRAPEVVTVKKPESPKVAPVRYDFHHPAERENVIPPTPPKPETTKGLVIPDRDPDPSPLPARIISKPKLSIPLHEESDSEEESDGVIVDGEQKKDKVDDFLM